MQRKWRIFPRPLMESVLNSHVWHHRVNQPLFLHGPRGVGKNTIIQRLVKEWNTVPHIVEYIDFHSSENLPPWTFNEPPSSLRSLRLELEGGLESLAKKGVELGCIGGRQVYRTLKKWHGIDGALLHFLKQKEQKLPNKIAPSRSRDETLFLWERALCYVSDASEGPDRKCQGSFMPDKSWENEFRKILPELASWHGSLDPGRGSIYRDSLDGKNWNAKAKEELNYFKEALLSLYLAKEVLLIHEQWRANAVEHLKRTGKFSRMLAHSATNWPLLLLEILTQAAQSDYFQPKLVINNFDMLRKAFRDSSADPIVDAAMYHDSLLLRLVSLGLNDRCIPVIFVTSDSYYSYQLYRDFAYANSFISRENFGWTPEEAKIHMVPDYFSEDEWQVIASELGSNSRHLYELYALKQSSYLGENLEENKRSRFLDYLDLYLGYLQVTVVNPAMESALEILKKFAEDVYFQRVQKSRLSHGVAWRHPPNLTDNERCCQWAKIQLIDFIEAFSNAEFGVNYLSDYSYEILDDPATQALIQVGLLYQQRDPSFLRPLSRGIQRCLVRWVIQEKSQLDIWQSINLIWHRVIRGRSYRHLMEG
ncbi:uncharacterized protein LOC131063178 isoform X2 [Cryptomeria japonica]|uniref:uncharacterized protein LOC131063178 isoform X2 n=1 Tax=Cryptomeria japonica TaxID=3369 RepID=UPI0027DA4B3B|nr:uncharacterized protein LOC131063178 isoform X2 [Cryptomeria japonica]